MKSRNGAVNVSIQDLQINTGFFIVEMNQETGNHKFNLFINHGFKRKVTIFLNEIAYFKWLFDNKNVGYTLLSHYGKGFDFRFLAKYGFKNKIKVFTIIREIIGKMISSSFALHF